jgi:GMT-like wHTH domain
MPRDARTRRATTRRSSRRLARSQTPRIFVSKNFLGYEIMREVMAKESSTTVDGVASFDYDRHPPLFLSDGRTVEALAENLVVLFAGTSMTVQAIYERHSVDKLYVKRNYKDALMRLEPSGRAVPSRAAGERRKGTLADDITIRFPRLPGTGVKIEASRPSARSRWLAAPS